MTITPRPELDALVTKASADFAALPPEQQEAVLAAQRESYGRHASQRGERQAFTSATERHGVAGGEAGLREALADLTDAFLSRHGCFPLDKTNDAQRHWNRAMLRAYELIGQPRTPARDAALASTPRQPSPGASGEREALGDDAGLLDALSQEIVTEYERQARNLANLWSDGNDGARTCILAALLRAHLCGAEVEPEEESALLTSAELRDLLGVDEDEEDGLELDDFGGIRTHDGQWRPQGGMWRFHPEEELGLLRVEIKPALAVSSPPAEMAGVEEIAWRPMDTAPHGKQIVARHKPNKHTPHGWIATIVSDFDDPDEHRRGGLDTILHYNGDTLQHGFHGCWTGWMWPEELAAIRTRQDTRAGGAVELYEKLEGDSLDAIVEVIGSPALYSKGKSAMRDWFLGRLRRAWKLPEPATTPTGTDDGEGA